MVLLQPNIKLGIIGQNHYNTGRPDVILVRLSENRDMTWFEVIPESKTQTTSLRIEYSPWGM